MNPSDQQSRIESLTLRQLYQLHEMCSLPQIIGGEEKVTYCHPPDEHCLWLYDTCPKPSPDRGDLREKIWNYVNLCSQREHGREAYPLDMFAVEDGCYPFIAIWDHWQPTLKIQVIGYSAGHWGKEELWDESSNDEA